MVHEDYEAEVEAGPGRQVGRLLATLVGVAGLIIGAFLDWAPARTGDKLDIKALAQPAFVGQSDFVRTVGGISVLIGLVALAGLVDRTGWLTRLAGAAALVVFVMFAIEAYRVSGHDFNTAVHAVRLGAWLQLAGGIVLLIGGFLGSRPVVVPATVEEPDIHQSATGIDR